MIIGKKEDGQYICQDNNGAIFIAPTREQIQAERDEQAKVKSTVPTDSELIEIGKKYHPYYTVDLVLENYDRTLQEIDEYDATH